VYSLHSYVGDALVRYGEIVLDVSQVGFIDSSGLGALVRLASKARAKAGDIKLCGLQQQARKALEMTNLLSVFETYDSIAEAIMAAYLGSRYSKDKSGDAQSRVLCVYDAEDVRTFLTEVLCRAGYNALATANVQDAALLLKATKAKLVIVGWNMRSFFARRPRRGRREAPGEHSSPRKQDGRALFIDRLAQGRSVVPNDTEGGSASRSSWRSLCDILRSRWRFMTDSNDLSSLSSSALSKSDFSA